MASERFVDALNAQIAREFAAAHQYVAIGAYYAGGDVPAASPSFFYDQAEEEREHAMKMVNYLLDRDAAARHRRASRRRGKSFGDHVEPDPARARAGAAGSRVKISELFEIARETRDYQSEQFMQWFLEEQVEEEAAMARSARASPSAPASIPMLLEEYLAREKPGKQAG